MAASAGTPSELLGAVRTALAPFVGATPQAVAASDPDDSEMPPNASAKARDLLARLEASDFDGFKIDLAFEKAVARELFSLLDR